MNSFEKLALVTKLRDTAEKLSSTVDQEILPEEIQEFLFEHYGEELKNKVWDIKRCTNGFTTPFFTAFQKLVKVPKLPPRRSEDVVLVEVLQRALPTKDQRKLILGPCNGLLIELSKSSWSDQDSISWALKFRSAEDLGEAIKHHGLNINFDAIDREVEANYSRSQDEYAKAERRYVETAEKLKEWKAFTQEIKPLMKEEE